MQHSSPRSLDNFSQRGWTRIKPTPPSVPSYGAPTVGTPTGGIRQNSSFQRETDLASSLSRLSPYPARSPAYLIPTPQEKNNEQPADAPPTRTLDDKKKEAESSNDQRHLGSERNEHGTPHKTFSTPQSERVTFAQDTNQSENESRGALMTSVQRSRQNTIRGSMRELQASGALAQGSSSEKTNCWVTVFGFPSSKASYVLKQFSTFGTIVDHHVGSGNWIHILYNKRIEAEKALCKNAKVFDSILMVGVVECIDPSIIRQQSPQTQQPAILQAPVERSHKRSLDEILYEEDAYFAQRKRLRQADEAIRPEKGFWQIMYDNIFSF